MLGLGLLLFELVEEFFGEGFRAALRCVWRTLCQEQRFDIHRQRKPQPEIQDADQKNEKYPCSSRRLSAIRYQSVVRLRPAGFCRL